MVEWQGSRVGLILCGEKNKIGGFEGAIIMSLRTLVDDLKTILDWRRGQQPVDYPLWLLLLLSLLSVMSGHSSLRGMSNSMARH